MNSQCDLVVELNGHHEFFLNKSILMTYCGRIAQLLKRARKHAPAPSNSLRLTLFDFPGGPSAFESAVRFCYSGGDINILPSDICALQAAAEVLEMTEEHLEGNLLKKVEDFLQDLSFLSWIDILDGLKGCDIQSLQIMRKFADALAWKLCTSSSDLCSPASSSPDSRESCNLFGQNRCKPGMVTWWFSDIAALPMNQVEMVLDSLIKKDFSSSILAKFLLHYVRSSLSIVGYGWVSKKQKSKASKGDVQQGICEKELLEMVINLLFRLPSGSASCRALLGLLRTAIAMNASKSCKNRLEKMIALQMHTATLDDILVPSHQRGGSLYDVDLVLRLLGHFVRRGDHQAQRNCKKGSPVSPKSNQIMFSRLASLVDSYAAEVAPDTNLKLEKFLDLVKALPEFARLTHDGLYRAVDIYLEAHPSIPKIETAVLCEAIDYKKISFEVCTDLAQNPRFSAKLALQALLEQRAKLKEAMPLVDKSNLLQIKGTLSRQNSHKSSKVEHLDPAYLLHILKQNAELRSGLCRMQTQVVELEKLCKNLRTEVVKEGRCRSRRLLC